MLAIITNPFLTALITLFVWTTYFTLGLVAFVSVAYLVTLMVAAVVAGHKQPGATAPVVASGDADRSALRWIVVVPAHNEEIAIGDTLRTLCAQAYPASRFEIAVVADNCADATVAIVHQAKQAAAQSGGPVISVWERNDLEKRGKGYALEWAFARLLPASFPTDAPVPRQGADAFALVDADTWVAPDFLSRMSAAMASYGVTTAAPEMDSANAAASETSKNTGQPLVALQGRYGVSNPEGGWRAALMAAAFDLCNHVKLLGAHRLGQGGVGLKGNGMAFTRATLGAAAWRGHSITEDIDYGLELLTRRNIRACYAPAARVMAQMPVTGRQAVSQRERWERGRYKLLRERALPLIGAGLRTRNAPLLVAGVDLLVPPLAELCALITVWTAVTLLAVVSQRNGAGAAFLPGPKAAWLAAPVATAAGLILYVVGGMRVAEASPDAWRALLRAPFYVAWKFVLYGGRFFSRFPPRRAGGGGGTHPFVAASGDEWVRTERVAVPLPPLPDVPHGIRQTETNVAASALNVETNEGRGGENAIRPRASLSQSVEFAASRSEQQPLQQPVK